MCLYAILKHRGFGSGRGFSRLLCEAPGFYAKQTVLVIVVVGAWTLPLPEPPQTTPASPAEA